MLVITSIEAMQHICMKLKSDGKSIRFVPTMGALHKGHSSLIRRACLDDDSDDYLNHRNDSHSGSQSMRRIVVVVSIFINPIQFNDRNDFVYYPETLQADLDLCRTAGVQFVFVPRCDQIYPSSQSSQCDTNDQPQQIAKGRCILKPPKEMTEILEGKSRDCHFDGVLTIVCKLFNIVQPDRAYFGLKDYQQLVLITKMTQDLNLPVRICPVETVREAETNLPFSSRNVRLNLEQRQMAAQIMYETLVSTKRCIEDKCRLGNQLGSVCTSGEELNSILLASLMTTQLCLDLSEDDLTLPMQRHNGNSSSKSAQTVVDYFELRCAKDLSLIDYDQNLAIFDCQKGCLKSKRPGNLESKEDAQLRKSIMDSLKGIKSESPGNLTADNTVSEADVLLDARLLISITVAGVRLLDNMGLQLNL